MITLSILRQRWFLPLRIAALAVLVPSLHLPAAETPDVPEGHSFHGEAFNEGPRQRAYLMPGTGAVAFAVTTKNPEAQAFFNQGIGQLHGFWYFEAERSFRQAAALDPDLAMAYWGMAAANTYNAERAAKFMTSAVAHKAGASELERRWVDAWSAFYLEKDKVKDKKDRLRNLVKALEKLVYDYPDHVEAKAFLIMQIVWENSIRNSIAITSHAAVDSLISDVLSKNPMHPIHHCRIHLWDSEAGERALKSAALCGPSASGIAHMWHMPGHIYSKLDRHADTAWQQEASARVDHAHMMRDHLMPDQIHNYAHNNGWLVRSLGHVGRAHDAIDLAINMIELPRLTRAPRGSADERSERNASATSAESADSYDPSGKSSYANGQKELLAILQRYELWDRLIELARYGVLEPGQTARDKAQFHRTMGIAHFSRGDASAGQKTIEELQKLLREEETRTKPDSAAKTEPAGAPAQVAMAPAAENLVAPAAAEKTSSAVVEMIKIKPDEKPSSESTASVKTPSSTAGKRSGFVENAIAELKVFAALAAGDQATARDLLKAAKDIDKSRLARLQFEAGQTEEAEKTALESVKSARNQVPALANATDLLERMGKTELAREHFGKLKELSAEIDLDMPVFQRLRPMVAALGLPVDWRIKAVPSEDAAKRPDLASLGPFRWQPFLASDWTLPGVDGKSISLSDYRGRPVIAIFYLGQGCRHCLEQLSAFSPMAERFAKAGISLVGISTDTVDGLKGTFEGTSGKTETPFPLVSDASLAVFKSYRAFDDFETMPLHGTFLIDGQGRVRWQDISYDPFMDADFLLQESQRLLEIDRSRQKIAFE